MAKTNQEEQRKAPILRFKGFTDDWEQRTLKEISKRVLRKNTDLISNRPLTISAQLGLVDQVDFFNKQVASSNLKNYILLKKGEFAYNKSYSKGYPFGTIKRLDLYENGAVSTLYIAFSVIKNVNSDYLIQLFSTNKWHKQVYMVAAEGARNHGLLNISSDDFFKINLGISTSKSEQYKIAELLNKISELIALYERKSKLLSQMEKYFLDNLFTENKYPNLRFKSYKDPWINKKISDFLSIPLKEKVSVNETSKILTVQLNLRGVTSGAVRSSLKLGATNYYKRKAGQLIYGKQNLFNGALAIIPEKYNNFVTSGDVPSLDINNISSDFIYYLFSRDNFYKKTEIYATGTGSKRIHEDVLLKIKIYVPQNINEQKQISNIIKTFIKIDSKYEKKLHLLRKIKQKLLDTMFI